MALFAGCVGVVWVIDLIWGFLNRWPLTCLMIILVVYWLTPDNHPAVVQAATDPTLWHAVAPATPVGHSALVPSIIGGVFTLVIIWMRAVWRRPYRPPVAPVEAVYCASVNPPVMPPAAHAWVTSGRRAAGL